MDTKPNTSDPETTVFADPVGYLASLGIAAELISDTCLPLAA